jgi:serine/threonine protein kinase
MGNVDIFINYRRADSTAQAGRLHTALQQKFGEDHVFMDTSSIHPGSKWPEELQAALKSARTVLVIIGPGWLRAGTDEWGMRPIDREEDWVRSELSFTFQGEHEIVPVLVGRAKMPPPNALPECLRDLTQRQPLELRDTYWEHDILLLMQLLQQKSASTGRQAALDPFRKWLQDKVGPRYKIERQLGQRNLALVYKAFDHALKRDVAIKVLVDNQHQDEFDESLREAIRISDEPSFITIYDACLEAENHYYVMQYIDGPTLRERIGTYGQKLPVDVIRRIFLRIGNALIRAQSKGFKHSNVKPSNIVLTKDDQPFISALNWFPNFDNRESLQELKNKLSHLEEPARSEELAYLLPEQFEDQLEEVSHERSAQYMLGLVAYELITGEIPPTLRSLEELENNKSLAFQTLPSMIAKRRECPQRLEQMILRMTERKPSDRYEKLEYALNAIRHVNPRLSLAKDSYYRCTETPGRDARFFKTFYNEFKKLCPEAELKFHRFGPKRWKRQYQMLKEAILLLFVYWEQAESEEPNVLSRIAQIHDHTHHNISDKFYKLFVDALVHTVCGCPSDCPPHFRAL